MTNNQWKDSWEKNATGYSRVIIIDSDQIKSRNKYSKIPNNSREFLNKKNLALSGSFLKWILLYEAI